MVAEIDEVVQEFLVESHDGLDQVEQDLVALEEDPNDPEVLARIFRTVHTIKGTCGFLGFEQLERLNHAAESLMVRVRDRRVTVNGPVTNALLATVDATRELMKGIEATGREGPVPIDTIIELLEALTHVEGAGGPADPVRRTQPPSLPQPAPVGPAVVAASEVEEQGDSPRRNAPESRTEAGRLDGGAIVAPKEVPEDRRVDEGRTVTDSSVRVTVDTLDQLMNLVGELVLVRNQILRYSQSATPNNDFLNAAQRLNHVTTELQEGIMKTRMQQIGSVWDKFPRVVRDLARSLGKSVRIEMKGKETELDRTIIEAIRDPLTHLVRNAVDHGLETPSDRERKGKPSEGVVTLSAYHEGGQVNIEISDDGAGLRLDKVRSRAIERGLVSSEAAARMTDREVANMIFLPGFSTADAVTNVSGRGVGMDVVKTNIERIGGTVDVQSVSGAGTAIKVKIPLTLAIIPALIVRVGEQRYAIPQVSLVELVHLEGKQVDSVERIRGTPLLRLRGNLLPLVDLASMLASDSQRRPDELSIVVLQADGQQFGLMVDAIQDTEEIVVKPLGQHLKGLDFYAGATIMGDGRVALILDVLGLAQHAGVLHRRGATFEVKASSERTDGGPSLQTLLLFDVGGEPFGVPLGMVDRLEELPGSAVESGGSSHVVQYRGSILPLASLRQELGRGSWDPNEEESLHVVVFQRNGRRVGLSADALVDIVETALVLDQVGRRAGVLGTAIIQGRVHQVLDVDAVVRRAFPELGQDMEQVR